jgi:hypothetical protein
MTEIQETLKKEKENSMYMCIYSEYIKVYDKYFYNVASRKRAIKDFCYFERKKMQILPRAPNL